MPGWRSPRGLVFPLARALILSSPVARFSIISGNITPGCALHRLAGTLDAHALVESRPGSPIAKARSQIDRVQTRATRQRKRTGQEGDNERCG